MQALLAERRTVAELTTVVKCVKCVLKCVKCVKCIAEQERLVGAACRAVVLAERLVDAVLGLELVAQPLGELVGLARPHLGELVVATVAGASRVIISPPFLAYLKILKNCGSLKTS